MVLLRGPLLTDEEVLRKEGREGGREGEREEGREGEREGGER